MPDPHATASHYDVLQLRSDASADEIRAAWRKLVREHHPDHGAAADGDLLQRINRAYEVLSSRHARAQYDVDLRAQRHGSGRSRRRWVPAGKSWLVLGGLAGVAISGAAGVLLYRTSTPPAPAVAVTRPIDGPDAPLTLVPARRLESWTAGPATAAATRP